MNAEQLIFNWQLRRDLVTRKAEEQWGASVVEQLSLDLQNAFPETKGFSAANLWRMKKWFLFYSSKADSEKLAQVVRELEFPQVFGLVPWGHHIDIIEHCKSIDEALFYVKKTIEGGWSRNTLMNCIKVHYYENLGGAITNFAAKLPSPQSELAQAITKDTYDFGFISLEEGYREEALETELEKQQ